MYKKTIPPHRVSFVRGLSRRFSMVAIGLFVLCSATLAFATAWSVSDDTSATVAPNPLVSDAEADLKSALSARLHLHLKNLGD